jgi:hypothetical protein
MVAIKQFRDSDSYVSLFEMQKYLSDLVIKALESLGCQNVFSEVIRQINRQLHYYLKNGTLFY